MTLLWCIVAFGVGNLSGAIVLAKLVGWWLDRESDKAEANRRDLF